MFTSVCSFLKRCTDVMSNINISPNDLTMAKRLLLKWPTRKHGFVPANNLHVLSMELINKDYFYIERTKINMRIIGAKDYFAKFVFK